jgi:hypothetical protein
MDFGEQFWISLAKKIVQAYESAVLSFLDSSYPPPY